MNLHLTADWLPGTLIQRGPLLMGWPVVLTQKCFVAGVPFLALGEQATRTERQWKAFLSWMFGICGTREVLRQEGYSWVAPVSAFYPENRQEVLFDAAPDWFEPDRLETAGDPEATVRLRPDYVAVRRMGDRSWELAVAESKGTQRSLERLDLCPEAWADQVRNIACKYDGEPLQPAQYLVVGTRASSHAKGVEYRRIQVRSWSCAPGTASVASPSGAPVEVARASLFGLCTNLGLHGSAESLALASRSDRARRTGRPRIDPDHETARTTQSRLRRSDELSSRRRSVVTGEGVFYTRIETPRSRVEVEFSPPLLDLLHRLGDPDADPSTSEDAFDHLDAHLTEESARLSGATSERENIAVGYGLAVIEEPRR